MAIGKPPSLVLATFYPPGSEEAKRKPLGLEIKLGLPIGQLFNEPTAELRKLVQLGEVLEIKAFPEPSWLPLDKPRVFHWGYGLVEAEFKKLLPALETDLKNCQMFSCDLGPAARYRQGILPTSKILSEKELETAMGSSLDLVRKIYSGPIGVENYNYYPTRLYERICEPYYLSRLLNKFDLSLVLDLAHAQVSAHNLQGSLKEYLRQLPIERVKEIHLSRPYVPEVMKNLAVDTHDPPAIDEFLLLESLLKAIPQNKPLVVIECYKSPQTLLTAYEDLIERMTAWGFSVPLANPKASSES
ncbi:MAG: DUF692 family protein [Deltaproteobacteria bacterium]|nr:DUF692 family protein [Deltaproteobacteria bacterium]